MTAAPAISVIVRTFNSEKTVGRLLRGLKLGPGDEVIVVDSGSTDKTIAVAATFPTRILTAPPPFNYSKSLNIGFRAAVNPWALVISSHSVSLVPDLLGEFRSVVQEAPADVAVIYGPNTLTTKTVFETEATRYFEEQIPASHSSYCGNGNALYRVEAWQRIPFDETIRTAEDKKWTADAFRCHLAAAFCPSARTLNQSCYSLRYMFMKGYSDSYSGEHSPMSLLNLGLSLGSVAKLYFRGSMPTGNWIRYSAHAVGRFYGSRRVTDNSLGT